MLMFRLEDRPRVVSGEITVTYRLWKTAKVKAGKLYRTGIGTIEIEQIDVMPAAMIAKRDIPGTGCPSITAIRELAGSHTNTIVRDDTLLFRVQFRFLGDVPVTATPAQALDIETLTKRLARMDASSTRGPWTLDVLRSIEAAPLVSSQFLSAELDWERFAFKAHVRKLKRLGLTISHEVGYELSVLGRECLASVTGGGASRPRRAAAARSPRTPRRSRS